MKDILGFRDENFYLSNFYRCDVPIKLEIENGNSIRTQVFWFSNSEAAFQAFKVFRNIDHPTEVELNDFLTFTELTASQAKQKGRNWKRSSFNLNYWNKIRDTVMEKVLLAKFSHNKDLKEKLLGTESAYLEETNDWGDKYWGVCDGEGENTLGKLLMKVRTKLIEAKKK